MAKAILLIRVSTQQQDLDQQTKAVMQEAFKEGFTYNDLIIIEEKESAIKLSEEERRGLNRMKAEIATDPTITHVFIYELSRLSRRQLVLFSMRDYLIDKKIQLVCCTPYFKLLENGKMSQTANLMFSIFASMAESEMELKKERLMRGRLHNKANGKNFGHPLLYGYRSLEDKTIAIDEEKAEVVRWLFTTYVEEDISMSGLAEKCKKAFAISMCKRKVGQLLANRRYCGDTEYPAIVSADLFSKCSIKRKDNIQLQKTSGWSPALLKRIIYDSKGLHMTYSHNRLERYLATDGKTSVNREAVDNSVWMLVQLLHNEYVGNKDAIQKGIEREARELAREAESLAKLKDKAWSRIDTIEERLIYGRISREKAEEMEKAAMREAAKAERDLQDTMLKMKMLEEKKAEAESAEPLDYNALDTGQKIALIRQMIEKVVISKPCRAMAIAKVLPKVGSFMYELEINVMTKEASMTSRMRLDDASKSTK